ncbi:NAD(P)-dependent oxidoreductase [Phytoactinopolyspora mesophila]|uniref:NAD(P)H-binding protein n=1 Tax=Phytoactinopolyspora mesophila TaxID=2650750 RepID=A0A7K3LZG0_9ACTN|nr:SDR family oxidoreductase [Phytoactinopolyspora mesophila]NDL56082.1 NAD(P)H-binding protein [Phytoactinopolyspora mesophila]
MKIAVLGATGGTGRHVVQQALEQDHSVTALVRSPDKLADLRHDRLHVVGLDVMDPAALEQHLPGHDAVVSAIGPRESGPSTACTDSAASIVRAMGNTGVRRLVVVSAAGPYTEGDGAFTRILVKPLLRRMLRHPFADMVRMEERIARSDVQWTVIRPPMLTDKALTGTYRMSIGKNVRRGYRIARADVAHAILRVLNDQKVIGTSVGVAS